MNPEAETPDHLFPGQTSAGITCSAEKSFPPWVSRGGNQEPGYKSLLDATCLRGHGEMAAAPRSRREGQEMPGSPPDAYDPICLK